MIIAFSWIKGDKENSVTGLVMKDRRSGSVCAHVCPKKGVGGGWIVKQFVRDIKKMGYQAKVTLRSDGEPAIKDLLDKVGQMRGAETILEQSKVGDSKANGRAERAIQAVEKLVRTLKIATEKSLGTRLSVKHQCFAWLVMHAADVITKCQVHKDGRTGYENIKSREYSGLMLKFGTSVLHKVEVKVQGGVMEPRWMKGVWLGKRFGTEEHIVTMDGKVVRSPAVKVHPEGEFDADLFMDVKGVPWDPSGERGETADGDAVEVPGTFRGNLP